MGLCTLLRLSNTNMGMVLLEQAWVFWLGELMQQVQWAMVRLRLGEGMREYDGEDGEDG